MAQHSFFITPTPRSWLSATEEKKRGSVLPLHGSSGRLADVVGPRFATLDTAQPQNVPLHLNSRFQGFYRSTASFHVNPNPQGPRGNAGDEAVGNRCIGFRPSIKKGPVRDESRSNRTHEPCTYSSITYRSQLWLVVFVSAHEARPYTRDTYPSRRMIRGEGRV